MGEKFLAFVEGFCYGAAFALFCHVVVETAIEVLR